MGKMIPLLIMVIAIEFSLFLFTGSQDTSNSLFNFVFNPTEFVSENFTLNCGSASCTSNGALAIIQATVFAFIIIAGLSAAVGFVYKQDSVIFASVSAGLGIISLISIVKLWQFIYSNMGGAAPANQVFASIVCAPIFIVWFIVVLDFIRGRD